ncbi:MAG: hypothetical protein RL150_87 [Candidatus Parcubacteria bacterium]|jgi:hypothetical protein
MAFSLHFPVRPKETLSEDIARGRSLHAGQPQFLWKFEDFPSVRGTSQRLVAQTWNVLGRYCGRTKAMGAGGCCLRQGLQNLCN